MTVLKMIAPQARALAAALLVSILLMVGRAPTPAAEPLIGPAPQSVEDRYLPEPPGIQVETWVTDLEAPWSLIFLPDGRALVSERPGRIRLIDEGQLMARPYATLDDVGHSEGLVDFLLRQILSGEAGLMGLAAHPRFPEEPWIYVMYTGRGSRGLENRVIRLRDRGDHGVLDRVIVDGIPAARNHNGGRIAFGPDDRLYVTTGETYEAVLADDLESLGGKILRLEDDGRIPEDNPFPGSPVWSYGHRNPQGLTWHPETGDLFASEHGPTGEFGLQAFDEINVIHPGRHYGWPHAVGAPAEDDFEDPLIVWTEDAVPPSGITFAGDDLFVASLRSQALLRIQLTPAGRGYRVDAIDRWFASGPYEGRFGRLRDVVVGPDRLLYVLTSNRDGRGRPQQGDDRILRLVPED